LANRVSQGSAVLNLVEGQGNEFAKMWEKLRAGLSFLALSLNPPFHIKHHEPTIRIFVEKLQQCGEYENQHFYQKFHPID
jgi:hypothetical protein